VFLNYFNQGKPMKKWMTTLALLTLAGAALAAAAAPLNQETQDDIAKHQKISAAHAEAAKCLAAGKPDAECEGALLSACKGIAFGKFCGMKH
jgi:uncharacterized protein YgiB involved in biofilm formation